MKKRFYKAVSTEASKGGFAILLDGRPLRTPVKAPLEVPAPALAEAIAAEWDGQGARLDPRGLILTKLANTAIDRVAPQSGRVVAEIVDYAASDLVCYRAAEPESLAARQSAAWDPVLDWARTALDADFRPVVGIVHQTQSPSALRAMDRHLRDRSPWDLAAAYSITTMLGSALLAAATVAGVTLVGERVDAPSLIGAADVLVSTSRTEGAPGVFVEALLAGVPVVAHDMGGVRDVVSPKTGSLVRAEDEEGLAREVTALAGDPQRRSRASAAARRAGARFRIEPVADAYAELYRELLSAGDRPAPR